MADKLTAQQQIQLELLATLPPRLEVAHRLIEELAMLRADDTMIRRLCRLLDEAKAAVTSIGQTALADTLGMMSMLARRGGDRQMRVRGLREGLASLKVNYEGAVRAIRLAGQAPASRGGGPPAGPPSAPPSR